MAKDQVPELLRSLNDPTEFTLTFELVPGRGGRTRELDRILGLAREIAADGRFQALSITENAGGHPALTPEVLGREIQAMGPEVIIHLSCKDKNRNQMESLLFGWDRQNIQNLLVLAGDYPKEGYRGYPKPVFDLDTVHVLDMLTTMNKGLAGPEPQGHRTDEARATSFIKGVVVSPFKFLEAELMMQYYKLHRKVAAGADFVITQVGYDARKFHELLLYMKQNRLNVPVLGNVFIPNLPVAELMYQGAIPGCMIPEPLYRLIRQEADSPDKGKRARLVRAAGLLAILKGLGYAGAHIGGPALSFADLDFVLSMSKELETDWQDCLTEISFWPEKTFWYFKKDEKTGLNKPEPLQRQGRGRGWRLAYALARVIHDWGFEPYGLLYRPMKKICLAIGRTRLASMLCRFEHIVKVIFFNCENCGDCSLAELAFLCPQSGCAKYLLNGACGGSRDGWCEVYPGVKRCLYVLIYERLKAYKLEEEMKKGFVPPRNWSLNHTSSWINFYSGLDHYGQEKVNMSK